MSPRRLVLGVAAGDGAAVALLVAGVLAGWLTAARAGPVAARGVTEMADAGVIVVCAVRTAAARRGGRRRFWGLLTIALWILVAGYVASALSRWFPATPLATVSIVALIAAYPLLLGALAVRAITEEGFESGLATFCDVGMLVTALLATCLPALADSLSRVGSGLALSDGVTWAGNVGLFAGGVWLLYRLPSRCRSAAVLLMVGSLGLFSLVSLADIVAAAHGAPTSWQIGIGYGVCYAVLGAAPRRDAAHPARGEDLPRGAGSWRAPLPYLALCPLIGFWLVSAFGRHDTLPLSGGIIVVSLLALTRQILLLRDHRAVIGAEHLRVRELTLMQEVARTLAATLDLDAVFAQVVRATSAMVSPPGSAPCLATLMRLEDGVLVSVAQHDEEGVGSFVGTRYPLATHPRLGEILTGHRIDRGSMADTEMSAATAEVMRAARLRGWAVAPLHVEGAPYGMLTLSARHRAAFEEMELERLGGIAHLAEMAIANALSFERQRDAAWTDHLTGLRNRRHFEDRLQSLPRERFALLAIDVDGLKAVNDEYGHEGGDEILRAVATTLGGLIRPGDVLARVGGDEFAVLLQNADAVEAEAAGERMQCAMYGTTVGRGTPRISVGFALGAPGDDGLSVWRRADEALYRAKRIGRDRVEGHTPRDVRERASSRAGWGELLSGILARQALRSAYQPIVTIEDRAVIGYEALARLHASAADDDVEELFATAKRLGVLRDLDWLGRRAAMAGAGPILTRGDALFINISSVALLDPVHDVDQMLLLCRWSGRDPEEVVLEITERETIGEVGRLRGVLASYREHGFRFALDDVGEGHSTLEVLTAARPEFVKIARSLVQGAGGDACRAAIRATVEFARATDAQVIAEGVETEADAEAMASLGVGCGQGWLFGRPLLVPLGV